MLFSRLNKTSLVQKWWSKDHHVHYNILANIICRYRINGQRSSLPYCHENAHYVSVNNDIKNDGAFFFSSLHFFFLTSSLCNMRWYKIFSLWLLQLKKSAVHWNLVTVRFFNDRHLTIMANSSNYIRNIQ